MIADHHPEAQPPSKAAPFITLHGQPLSLEQIEDVAYRGAQVVLSEQSILRMSATRDVVERIIREGTPVYGISTGFGRLCDVSIAPALLEEAQLNLVRSHCCGVGELLSEAETRAIILLRANVIAKGNSGARPEVALALCQLLNRDIHPDVPSRGSVGASGDLAPLAHIALCLIGEGECRYGGKRMTAGEALKAAGLSPLHLEAKEGLALINGTQALTALGALTAIRLKRLAQTADLAAALTLEALQGTATPFDERIHSVRPHRGQIASAALVSRCLLGSQIQDARSNRAGRVQDAYSLRCVPQVHGAFRDAVDRLVEAIEVETGSATDNPLVFPDGTVLSGGNFHGAPIAMALDYAALATAGLVGIAERRVDRLLNPDTNEGLPAFLSRQPGLGSGMMLAHVTMVALLNEIKVLSSPASIDNLPTSAGTEDHVSMGMTAALKLATIATNAERCLAIELIAAAEALEHRKPLEPGALCREAVAHVRTVVAPLMTDRPLSKDIEGVAQLLREGSFMTEVVK